MDRAARRLTAGQERGSDRHGGADEPRYLVVGQVLGAHGIRGELKVEILTEDPHRFGLLQQVLVGLEDKEPVPWILEGYRLHKGHALLKLQGCDDRTAAEMLRGYYIQVHFEDALPLEEDEYFEHQIVGLQVWTAAGELLGEVAEILYTGANDVYVVRGGSPGRRDILIPAIEDVVLEVDLDGGRLVVELPEGLL